MDHIRFSRAVARVKSRAMLVFCDGVPSVGGGEVAMSAVDIGLLILLFFFGLRGFWKGFFHELMSLLAVVTGCVVGLHFAPGVSEWLSARINITSFITTLLAFLLIYTPVFLGIRFGRSVIERFWQGVHHSSINGLAGLFFGMSKGGLVLGCAIILLRIPLSVPGMAYAGDLADKVANPVGNVQAKLDGSPVANALATVTLAVFSTVVGSGSELFRPEEEETATARVEPTEEP